MLIGKNPNRKFNVNDHCSIDNEKNKKRFSSHLGARSIWERALDIDYRNIAIWIKYAEMEMRWCSMISIRFFFDRFTFFI